MAIWEKEYISIPLFYGSPSRSKDTRPHTMEIQPIDQDYPTGAVDGVQGTDEKWIWYPASDLDTTKSYDVYVDVDGVQTKYTRIHGPDTAPEATA